MIQGQLTKMYMGLLEKSPEIGPLLVRLYDRHKIHKLSSKGADARISTRAELAGIMADLLDIDLKADESELITDVLIGLLSKAEIDLRAALAERLAVMDGIPLRMVLHIANDEIEVARPVLINSKSLTDMDLLYIVKATSSDHWQAIAKRERMSDFLIDALVDTKDMGTAINLSENENVVLTSHAVKRFSNMSRFSDELAKSFVMRNELPKSTVTKIYQHVGRDLKEYIREQFAVSNMQTIDGEIDDIVSQITAGDDSDFTPSVDMIISAENMMERGLLTPEIMIANLRRGQVVSFVAQFSVYCGLLDNTIRDILSQKSAQGLAIACKATNIPKHDFVNMFLLTHRLRNSTDKVVNKNELALALKYYDKITERMAREILNESRH